jgi:hypothetical protein
MYPMQWMRLIICCGMAVKRMGMIGVSEEDRGTDCEGGDSNMDW